MLAYGRGAASIAMLRKAEGDNGSIDDLTAGTQQMIDTWKRTSYPQAWNWLEGNSRLAVTEWKVTNPWGRSRRFSPTANRKLLAEYGRQGANAVVQSTVADTCNIALHLILEERAKRGLHFQVCNQVHDAIMVMCPISEIEAMRKLFNETMGSVEIPLGPGRKPLVLGVDIEVMSRWGKEYKEKHEAA